MTGKHPSQVSQPWCISSAWPHSKIVSTGLSFRFLIKPRRSPCKLSSYIIKNGMKTLYSVRDAFIHGGEKIFWMSSFVWWKNSKPHDQELRVINEYFQWAFANSVHTSCIRVISNHWQHWNHMFERRISLHSRHLHWRLFSKSDCASISYV